MHEPIIARDVDRCRSRIRLARDPRSAARAGRRLSKLMKRVRRGRAR